jgi:hypothetical protein
MRRTQEGGVEVAMQDMMNAMGGMMWGIGLPWLLAVVVLVLGAAALVKYLLSQQR